MINRINSVNFKANPYGNIQRLNIVKDGRVFYGVTDSNGESAGKLSVLQEDAYTFEEAYNDIMETAPKIKNYVDANSSPYDIKKRRTLSMATVAGCGLIGGITPAIITMGIKSGVKKILYIIAGTFIGLTAGFWSSMALTTPPDSYKFAKASRTLNKLDIQRIRDEDSPIKK